MLLGDIMVTVKVDVRDAQRKLRSVSKSLDQKQALTAIGRAVQKWIELGFRSNGHGKWERLAPNTVAKKGHSRPLVDTGKMQGSIKSRVFNNHVRIGTFVAHAPFHEFGTRRHLIESRGARFMRFRTTTGPAFAKSVDHPGNPARPMLPDEATATKLAVDVVNKIVKAAVAKAGK